VLSISVCFLLRLPSFWRFLLCVAAATLLSVTIETSFYAQLTALLRQGRDGD
jgi:hypothetical protein